MLICRSNPSCRRRNGFGYIEAVISSVVLGTALIAALQVFGGFVMGVRAGVDEAKGRELAADLMAEIQTQRFEDPTSATGSFGTEAGETTRLDFDDVDDYNGLDETPPRARDGTHLSAPDYGGFHRKVAVVNVDIMDFTSNQANGTTPAKRITVSVLAQGKVKATLIAYRTRNDAW